MCCPSSEELNEMLLKAKHYTKYGTVAEYIPALKKANPQELSAAIYRPDGTHISAGDIKQKITLQSISKVLTLALALMDRGEPFVFHKVGYEPTGDPYHSILKLEISDPPKPLNPMINAGALAVTHMIKGKTIEERFQRILSLVQQLAGNPAITYSQEVAESEFKTAFLNRSLCYYIKQQGIITEDVEELIYLYTKQCAIELDCFDLARIGVVFAMDGVEPMTGKRLLPADVARLCKTFMVTCGMYNASGEFAAKVGIPAKSGVSGGIMGAVPNRLGIGVFGPALDDKGNSIAGIKLLEMLSARYSLSMF